MVYKDLIRTSGVPWTFWQSSALILDIDLFGSWVALP